MHGERDLNLAFVMFMTNSEITTSSVGGPRNLLLNTSHEAFCRHFSVYSPLDFKRVSEVTADDSTIVASVESSLDFFRG